MKPLIGISANTIGGQNNLVSNPYDGQKKSYSDAIRLAGGVPVIIPVASNIDDVRDVFYQLDAVVFAGGGDISPQRYGEELRYAQDIDEARDWHEVALMEMALSARRPLLAICRGMQLLNVVRGGSLYQDIPLEYPNAIQHRATVDVDYPTHEIIIDRYSALARILGRTSIIANTSHHQAVKYLGGGLQVCAWAEDGIVEAVEDMESGYVMGVQSHPERMVRDREPRWGRLFRSLVKATSQD